jgi:hypothetical protein
MNSIICIVAATFSLRIKHKLSHSQKHKNIILSCSRVKFYIQSQLQGCPINTYNKAFLLKNIRTFQRMMFLSDKGLS